MVPSVPMYGGASHFCWLSELVELEVAPPRICTEGTPYKYQLVNIRNCDVYMRSRKTAGCSSTFRSLIQVYHPDCSPSALAGHNTMDTCC